MSDEPEIIDNPEIVEPEELDHGAVEAQRDTEANQYFRSMVDRNFLEYASYVIKDRAIPDVDDGLKPVQRRILWSLKRLDDGKFHKVANVIGHTMQFHPHGDASIGDALVVLANKEYFIDRQGNFGNIYTGDGASAPRYIECRLSEMGREVLFNHNITEMAESYDGRNQEPVILPVKIPALLMLGTEGIAVGMSTRILPHNFNEVLQAQIAVLKGEDFELYPDFQQGGLMDVREYARGNGRVIMRARIDIDGRKLIIRELPATTTTESLIASIERAVEKGRIKIASVNDYTAEKVEIEVTPTRGYDPGKALQALYSYTDCSKSISVNMMVICENRPVEMNTDSVIRRNTEKLLAYLRRELEIELERLAELFHAKTLAQIFIENRIYKKIEECESSAEVETAVLDGLAPFRDMLRRDVTHEDIEKLLALQIRRISLFDIRKNQEELKEILEAMAEAEKNLRTLTAYAIRYLQALLKKYGDRFPRRTEIENLEKIDRREAALCNIKVGWDRKNGYIGTAVKSEDNVMVSEFDRLQCLERNGNYKIIPLTEKLFAGKLYDFRRHDAQAEYAVIYRDNKTGKFYGKRCRIDKFIVEREYALCPKNCRVDLFTPRPDAVYEAQLSGKRLKSAETFNLMEMPLRSARARGLLLFGGKAIDKLTHQRYLEAEELAALRACEVAPPDDDDDVPDAADAAPEIAPEPETVPAPEVIPEPEIVPEITPEPEVIPEPEIEPEVVPEPEIEPEVVPEPEIVPEVTPEPEVVPEPEIVPEITSEPEDISEPEVKTDDAFSLSTESGQLARSAKTRRAKPAAMPDPEPKPAEPSREDDLGIVQPEFGF